MTDELLTCNIRLLDKQLSWLKHSYQQATQIGIKTDYTMTEFDVFENLSSRYARTIDFLIRKVFRSIDEAEFEPQGTLIDVVNNAHKRNLFNDIEQIRAIKDLRDAIAHEYIEDALQKHFSDLLIYTEQVIKIVETTLDYVAQKHSIEL